MYRGDGKGEAGAIFSYRAVRGLPLACRVFEVLVFFSVVVVCFSSLISSSLCSPPRWFPCSTCSVYDCLSSHSRTHTHIAQWPNLPNG